MARTAEGATLTEQHRQRQLALRAAVIRDMTTLWPLWQLDNPESFDRFVAATVTLIRARHRDSAGLAANYFRAFRTVEGIGGDLPIRIAESPPVEQLTASLRSSGLAGTFKALQTGRSPQAARQIGFVKTSGAASRHVMNGGRNTILQSAGADPKAQGWIRKTSGSPCAFCAMLASRGHVYKSSATAAGGRWSVSDRQFKVHDHCSCSFEAAYRGSQLPAENQRFREQWNEAQREAAEAGELKRGTSNDALNAFRRHYQASAT